MTDPSSATAAQRPLLLLWGAMASGKSTVGRLVAGRASCPFWDLDDRIEQASGQSIAALFARRGEPGFRALEQAELTGLLDEALGQSQPVAVALGGGALLDPRLRQRALDEAFVVTLTARPDTIVARALAGRDDPATDERRHRPLLRGPDPGATVAHLLKQREAAYRQAHAVVVTDERSPGEVAEAVWAHWTGARQSIDPGKRTS